MKASQRWPDYRTWQQYGISVGYEGRNPSSLANSKLKEERSWYIKGLRKGWLKDFDFERRSPLWKDRARTISYAREIMKENGWKILPSDEVLTEYGYSGFSSSLLTYHGGIQNFRKMLGQKNPTVERGQLDNLDYVLDEINKIMVRHKLEDIPATSWLGKHGYWSIRSAILRKYGGSRKFGVLLVEKFSNP